MKEQTIYSYKLLYRLRWRLVGPLVQLLLLGLGFALALRFTSVSLRQLIVSLAIVVVVPILQFLFFRLYAYAHAQSVKLTPGTLFSPWWGASTPLPVSLSFFRGVELTVCAGSLLISSALYVWLPHAYGLALLLGGLVLLLPRLSALFVSWKRPDHCRVKYEGSSISFLTTDG